MKTMLLQRVKRGDVLKFNGVHVSRDSDRFKVKASVQCQGTYTFDQMSGTCHSEQQLAVLLNRLLQLHIWNAPEDSSLLSEWRYEIRQWVKTNTPQIEFSEHRIEPFKSDLFYLAKDNSSK